MTGKGSNEQVKPITNSVCNDLPMPLGRNLHLVFITALTIACSLFYYMDILIDFAGWRNVRWSIFYTVHDLHRALFLIPAVYTAYVFRGKGIAIISCISLLIFLPRALLVSPYPDPLLRALIFVISMAAIGILLSLLLNNISERKKLEQNLRAVQENVLSEAQDYLDSLIKYARIPIIAWDKKQQITIFNAAFEKLTGYGSSEMLRRPLGMLFPETGRNASLARIERSLEGAQVDTEEVVLLRRDGDVRIVLWNAANIYDGTGKTLLSTIAQAQDITERKKTAQALLASKEYIEKLNNSLFDAVFVVKFPERLIEYLNNSAVDMFGYAREEMLGKNSLMFYPDEERYIHSGSIIHEAINQKKNLVRFETILKRKEGTIFPGLLTATFIRENDDVAKFIIIVQDITENKRKEENLRQLGERLERKVAERTRELHDSQLALLNLVDDLNESAKNLTSSNAALVAVNKELAAFSYSVSHDLRAPLRSIDGFSSALLEDCNDRLDEEGKNYLNRIRRATQTMSHLIDDMLNLSRVTQSEMSREEVDLSKMIRNIAATFDSGGLVQNVKLHIQEGILAKADKHLIRIALTNLLDNAWKFVGKQEQPQIEFGKMLQDGKEVFFIRDNGVGFDMAHAGKLFGAFQRLHRADEFPGTGIGLATVQRIIHRHGGEIWTKAEAGKGATFFFTLPS